MENNTNNQVNIKIEELKEWSDDMLKMFENPEQKFNNKLNPITKQYSFILSLIIL